MHQAPEDDLTLATHFLARAPVTRLTLSAVPHGPTARFTARDDDIAHAERQIDQVRRRVRQDARLPHAEKVFSLFEPQTEWITKGKAGVPVEWGLRVWVSEDQYGFLLSHRVMPQETDDPVAIPVVTELAQRFPNRHSVSLDQGFHRPAHQERRAERVPLPVLPQQGKGNATAARREADPEFRRLRRQHAAVASAINALAAPGLDRCPDHGLDGLKRYVVLAVVGRNRHRLGALLLETEAERGRPSARKRAA